MTSAMPSFPPTSTMPLGRWCRRLLCGLVAVVLLGIAGCARLPLISRVAAEHAEGVTARCEAPFVTASWRFVHAISAELPGRRLNQLIGVSVIDPGTRAIDAALMTIEGLVVFAARWDGAVSVSRALPPFERKELAEGLMADMRLLFLAPPGSPVIVGQSAGGLPSCRYAGEGQTLVDVVVNGDRSWEITRYSAHRTRERTIRAGEMTVTPPHHTPLPKKIDLTAHGTAGYHLILTLISAELAEM